MDSLSSPRRRSLQRQFMALVAVGIVFLSCGAVGAIGWLQQSQMMHNIEAFSRNELGSLHALIVSVMAKRVEDPEDVGISVFNNWFKQRNSDYPGELWSTWSPAVTRYMHDSAPGTPPKRPQDAIDEEALRTGTVVGRVEGDSYRMALPIVLGVTPGADQEVCFSCHGAMGLQKGDVIAVLSSRLTLSAERDRLFAILAALVGGGVGLTVLGMLAVRLLLARLVTGPVSAMTRSMDRLAAGDLDCPVEGTGRGDEIGAMARALTVFRANALEKHRLEGEQAREAAARNERMTRIEGLVRRFEETVAQVLATLATSTQRLHGTARSMTETADVASERSDRTAEAATTASGSVQAVFAAADQLASSIRCIGDEVTRSAQVSKEAVAGASRSAERVRALEDAARQVGSIVDLINGIAEQTNLLALNATIEAARAGEAGKGFAVVAGEVKQLASQTMAATRDIMDRVNAIGTETAHAVDAVNDIASTIQTIDGALASIASSVEQQDSATRDIAASSQRAAAGTIAVSDNIRVVVSSIHKVDEVGHALTGVIEDLATQAQTLRQEVDRFLSGIRTA
ncbi:methyl-accepting chemotaxis protein [Azospirillum fermentarium]|uniref:methyl-accepting chemotaxis protein n=1 Tax=Azospirillum fermentarium TaxID=1233114 RepID=UPI002226F741|nr:HAMP domain-containing methyl-accepting chemotaxis protein [Azospirillum fermentarium]MCW2247388.1 methyl-accepting chemotaxis protein [Azospirillum fermentarium]